MTESARIQEKCVNALYRWQTLVLGSTNAKRAQIGEACPSVDGVLQGVNDDNYNNAMTAITTMTMTLIHPSIS